MQTLAHFEEKLGVPRLCFAITTFLYRNCWTMMLVDLSTLNPDPDLVCLMLMTPISHFSMGQLQFCRLLQDQQ